MAFYEATSDGFKHQHTLFEATNGGFEQWENNTKKIKSI